MTQELFGEPIRICKGPRHREGKQLPATSFASERSKWCRGCMSDYDKQRGPLRGASRASKKTTNQTEKDNNMENGDENGNGRKKGKTQDLPGMTGEGVAPVRIKSIEPLAEAYCKERDKRVTLTPKEVEAKRKLSEEMHKHADKLRRPDGFLVYRYDDREIVIKPGKEKLSVREIDEDDEEED